MECNHAAPKRGPKKFNDPFNKPPSLKLKLFCLFFARKYISRQLVNTAVYETRLHFFVSIISFFIFISIRSLVGISYYEHQDDDHRDTHSNDMKRRP